MEDAWNLLSRILVTRHGVWVDNWIYWNLTTRNYKYSWRYRYFTPSPIYYRTQLSLLSPLCLHQSLSASGSQQCLVLFTSLRLATAARNSSQIQSYVMTDGQSASLTWCQAPIWNPTPDFCYCQTDEGLIWGALSNERTGLSFTTTAGPRQRSHSRVRVPWNSWPYFTVSDWRLHQPWGSGPYIYIPGIGWPSYKLRNWNPFVSPPTIRRSRMEVFEPAFILYYWGCIRCRGEVLIVQLPSKGRLFSRHYSGFNPHVTLHLPIGLIVTTDDMLGLGTSNLVWR
jgi:hypothetical protein